jgi:hypothetical protein
LEEKKGVKMKRLTVLAALVLVITLGSYAIFAAHSSHHGGNDVVTGGAMNGGMMDNMSCSGCAMVHTAVAATNDGGVIVAAAGKLIKYDAALTKVIEVDISSDLDPNAANPKPQ